MRPTGKPHHSLPSLEHEEQDKIQYDAIKESVISHKRHSSESSAQLQQFVEDADGLERMLNEKLHEKEKKLAEEKLFKEDLNREFVIEKANEFLQELPEVNPMARGEQRNVKEGSSSGSSNAAMFEESKKNKQLHMYVVDPGRRAPQTR